MADILGRCDSLRHRATAARYLVRMRWILTLLLPALAACSNDAATATPRAAASETGAIAEASAPQGPAIEKLVLSEEKWKERLTPGAYRILREAGTERAFTGALWNEHRTGTYSCAGCGLELFSSQSKYDSKTGWPSYWQPLDSRNVSEHEDRGLFSVRTEIRCSRCDGHLGHLFDDGPLPTGLRYCMNSAALRFEVQKDAAARE